MTQITRHTYRVDLAYDGSGFFGFARQVGLRTLEGVLVEALKPFVPELLGVSVGGRTDRGVHAVGQVISFWSRQPLDEVLVGEAIDRAAPNELAVLSVRRVPSWFHAQHSARGRRYVYLLPDPEGVDPRQIARLFAALIGTHNFGAFARDTKKAGKLERRLVSAECRWVQIDGIANLRFDLEATGFLRHMVRILVATSVREAQGFSSEEALLELLRLDDRRRTAPPAPAGGLYLVKVLYDPGAFS